MKALANIANVLAGADQYKCTDVVARKLLQGLWQHAIVTAHCTDALATTLKIQNHNTFIAGLLHDIGKVVLVDTIFTRYTGATGRLKESPEILARAIAPYAPLVGLHVIQHWKLAPELCFATFYAQQPELTPDDKCRPEIHCIRLASDIAESKGYGIGNSENIVLENHPDLAALGLAQEDLNTMVDGLEDMLSSVLGVLGSLD